MTETTRAGAIRRPAFYLIITLMLAVAASCYSSSYEKEVAANTDLLTSLADKLGDYCQAGFIINDRPISSEEMGEFDYAQKKARGFSASRSDESSRASYHDFMSLLEQYAAFVHSADEYRLASNKDEEKLKALTAEKEAIEQTALKIRADLLAEEHRG